MKINLYKDYIHRNNIKKEDKMKITKKEGVVGFVKKIDENREVAFAYDTLAQSGEILDLTFKGYVKDFRPKQQSAQDIIDTC